MYDLIIIGRGLSSLLFLKQYLLTHSDLKILIIEKSKSVENRYISSWQGPGILDLKKEYGIDPDKVYKKISISNEEILIKKNIAPYSYNTYDYKHTIETIFNSIKDKVEIIYDEVISIKEKYNEVNVKTKKHMFISQYLMSSTSLNKQSANNKKMLYQYFIGTKIKINKNHTHDTCQLMHFLHSNNEVLFNYNLPFDQKTILIETTAFGKKVHFENLEKIHKRSLATFNIAQMIKKEKGVIPMSVNHKFQRTARIINIGIHGGFARPSSGYMLLRAAQWSKINKDKNLKDLVFKEKIIINFLDKIFLKACYYYPDKANSIFVKLFNSNDIASVIRFLADIPKLYDIVKILINTPKKIMINALIK